MNDTECPYVAGYICMCCITWELLLVYRDVLWTKNKVVVLCCRRQRIIFNSLIKNWPSLKFPLISIFQKISISKYFRFTWRILDYFILNILIFNDIQNKSNVLNQFTLLRKYYKKNSKPLKERKHFPSRIILFSLSFMITI